MPILDSLTVGDGMEKALTAYLAEELTAPAGSGETAYWRGGGDAASLSHPEGSSPLSAHVSGAPELAAALSGVGIVDSAAEAQVMQPSLRPGQALTTREGGLWRWDGFVRRSAAQDSSAERIRQRRRATGCRQSSRRPRRLKPAFFPSCAVPRRPSPPPVKR